jgi:hypothetical protein
MVETANNPMPTADEDQLPQETLREQFFDWARNELVWYAGSFTFHLLALSVLLLLPNFGGSHDPGDDTVLVSKAEVETGNSTREPFDPLNPGDFEPPKSPEVTGDLPLKQFSPEAGPPIRFDDSKIFEREGGGVVGGAKFALGGEGGGGAALIGAGGKLPGPGGLMPGLGTGTQSGSGGKGAGFGEINRGKRGGSTGRGNRAVDAALAWLAKHQDYDGHWSLQGYAQHCKPGDRTCTGTGDVSADAGATAMGLLPFLAAGKTHKTPGDYQEAIRRGIAWLVSHQQPDGNLAKGAEQMMYSHGLATIALCEAYGLTGDRQVGRAAQLAVNFILSAQNTVDGGWRYNPQDPGDTSVVGWQLMALKSAQMAGLDVGGSALSGASKWLDSVASHGGAEYAYQPGQAPINTMTSVGLLCRQYLGAKRDNPMLSGGMAYLLNHMPDEGTSNVYYWYYATQVMHNMNGPQWDAWNRKIRNLLVATQVRHVDECANGSWAPENDTWGRRGGRLMQTSLATLTLEVPYRYLPLFKAEADSDER